MLQGPPDENTLSRIYFELSQIGASSSGEKLPWPYHPESREELLALGSEMSRYDPRLLGILVEYFARHWKEIRPQALRAFFPVMETPQTVAVIAEFVKHGLSDPEARYWADYLQQGLKKVPSQWYFRNLYSPGGGLAQNAAEQSLTQYLKWGFFAREFPTIDVFKKTRVGRLSPEGRLNRLRRMFARKGSVGIGEYLEEIGQTITRQQALQDLEKIARIKRGTAGRGARWVLKKRL